MAMLRGTHICAECKTEFEWDSLIGLRYSTHSSYDAETISRRYVHAGCDPELPNQTSYVITLECPHCGSFERFDYSPEK